MSLADSLNSELMASTENRRPDGFDVPGVDYSRGTGTIVRSQAIASTDYRAVFEKDTGYPVPEGLDVVLERATVQRTVAGVERYWYKFKFAPKLEIVPSERLTEIATFVKRQRRAKTVPKVVRGGCSVISIADLQLGKTSRHGGTEQTVTAFYDALEQAKDYVKRHKPEQLCLSELGDGIENFENVESQKYTNDRSLVEQLGLHTELLTHATVELSKLTDNLVVAGVPSNHMEVRRDGKPVGGPDNDFGLLSLSNVKRAVELNPKAFGHVQFAWPNEYEVSMTLNLSGTRVGMAHGNYSRGAGAADSVPKWLAGQFAGNHPLQPAQIVLTAHFHHLRAQNIIGGRWWFQAPTLDRGSAWLEWATGEGTSQNGMLALTVQDGTWRDLELLKTA